MHEISNQHCNALIEQKARKEYGWDDWLDEYPDFLNRRDNYSKYINRRSPKKHPQASHPITNRSSRPGIHTKDNL